MRVEPIETVAGALQFDRQSGQIKTRSRAPGKWTAGPAKRRGRFREGEAPAEPGLCLGLGGSLALPMIGIRDPI